MDTALYTLYAAVYLLLLAWAAPGRRAGAPAPGTWVVYLLLGALLYDNTVLAVGNLIGEGAVLEVLSYVRYWAHALITPLLVLFCWGALVRAGPAWARSRWSLPVAGALTGLLVAVEVWQQTWGLRLVPEREYGVLSYTAAQTSSGPPAMVLLVTVVLLVTGGLLWWRAGWPWLLLGAVVMGVGSAVPVPVPSAAVTNAFEVALLTSVVATHRRLRRS